MVWYKYDIGMLLGGTGMALAWYWMVLVWRSIVVTRNCDGIGMVSIWYLYGIFNILVREWYWSAISMA